MKNPEVTCLCGTLTRESCEAGFGGDVDDHPTDCLYVKHLWVTKKEKEEIDKDYEEED